MNFIENPAFKLSKVKKDKQCISLLEIYRAFRAKKLVKSTAKDYQAICKDFMQLVHDAMVYEGFEFNPKCNIGKFSIRQRKTRLDKLRVDFRATKKLRLKTGDDKAVVYHLNNHSNHYYYHHSWKKGNCTGVMMWAFKATFENKVKITEAVRDKTIKPFKPKLKC